MIMQCTPKHNSEKYIGVLQNELVPLYDLHNIFMQDGVRSNTSQLPMNFIKSEIIMLLLHWPAQFPDINIIENL